MNQVTLDTICVPSDNIVAREIEGELIIVPLVSGIGDSDDELYTLNETGKAIWDKLDGNRTLAHVAEALGQEFSSHAEKITADVLAFSSEMTSRGILVVKQ